MHCYRCGRRVPDRSPRCDNCGQKFNYGDPSPAKKAEAEPAPPPAPPVVSPGAPPPKSGLRDSIFEVSQTSGRERERASDSGSGDPTVPASMALTDATDQAVIELGSGRRAPIETSSDAPIADTTATSPAPPRPPPFVDPDASAFSVGKILSGRLEIVADLGGGPLGRVFKAVDRKKGSVVAVKAIPASRLPSEALSGRFAEMIQLVKGLTHPNLVRVHGAGRDGDTAFVIMQHLEGLPLRRLLDVKRENGGTFTFEEAEPIVVQICQGLQFAHGSLVHGGLKPENVFVQVDSLKLIDAGFSRLFAPGEWREVQKRAKNGAAYLAPEFADGERRGRIDRRADVYSVGAILYEMLTGRVPSGPDAPPVSSLNPSVPRAVDRVVQKAMAASPENRYATAAELKDAVLRVLGGDILADDLEAAGGDMGTFVAPDKDEADPGIEIEYVEAAPDPEPDRKSDDATPVGAIELQEPLWEPDEIAETRASDPSHRTRGTEPLARPVAGSPPVMIVNRPISKQEPDDRTATSAIVRPALEVEDLADTAKGARPAPRAADRISAENTSVSGLDEAGHQSIDLGEDAAEPTANSGGDPDLAPDPEPPRATPSWLDRVEERPRREPKEPPPPESPDAVLSPRTLPPVAARPRAEGRRSLAGGDVELSEGSPLDLELDDPDAPPTARPPVPPTGDAPTIRRPAPVPPLAPSTSPSGARRPAGTPPPWDARDEAPPAQLADRDADRPTDPRTVPVKDRPGAPRTRWDDNPAARALSPPAPPPLELTFSQAEEGPEGAPPVDRPTADAPHRVPDPAWARPAERPTADAPAPLVKPGAAPGVSPRLGERPTLTGGGAGRPAFVTRRSSSKLPLIVVFLVFLVATAGGGGWAFLNRDKLSALLPQNVPETLTCPEGMIAFGEGAFLQGSNKLDPDRDITELVSRDVSVKAFCIDRFEYPNEPGAQPLTGVTFDQAASACASQGKRLCTETEWERACKGSAGSRFPYGDQFEAGMCNVATGDTPGKPQKSGAFARCGAGDGPRDLSGNVWEITATPWPDDPEMRVIKGGSARLPAWGARCAYRDAVGMEQPTDDIGFRCCRS